MMRTMVLAGLMVLAAGCSESPMGAGTDRLVGVWLPDEVYPGGEQPDNPQITMEFYADGRLRRFAGARGTWKRIDAQTLELVDPNFPKSHRFWMKTKDQLTIYLDWEYETPANFHRWIPRD